MSYGNHPIITSAITATFPEYSFIEREHYRECAFHLYETMCDPNSLTLEEKQVTHFLTILFHFPDDKLKKSVTSIEIEVLRKTAALSGKTILQKVSDIARLMRIPKIVIEDNAELEFTIDNHVKEADEADEANDIRKRIISKELAWTIVRVKTMPLTPLLILCGQHAYYAGQGFLLEDQEEIDEYNRTQIEKTIREMSVSPIWPGFNTSDKPFHSIEAQEEHLRILACLDGYWDQPIRVFFQHVKNSLKTGKEINFDFVKRFIEDLVKCGFIRYERLVPLTKMIEL
jgi:hypothetical protein